VADPLAWLDDAPEPPAPPRKVHARPPAADPLAWLDDAPALAPPVDMGPTARAARGGGSPSRPRDLTAEEAGTLSGPVSDRRVVGIGKRGYFSPAQQPEREAAPETDYVRTAEQYPSGDEGLFRRITHQNAGPAKTIIVSRGNQQEMGDPLVQMGTATAAGMATGGLASELGVPALVARAAEGAVANKAQGGDLSTGAALALVPNAASAVRAAAQTVRAAPAAAGAAIRRIARSAPARVDQAAVRAALGEDALTQAKTKTANTVAATEPERLREVFRRNEDLRGALHGEARANPEKAHAATSTTIAKADARLDNDYAAIDQRIAQGGKGTKVILADVRAGIADLKQKYIDRGELQKVDAVDKADAFLVRHYKDDAAVLTASQLRGMKRELGKIGFSGDTTTPRSVKAEVHADLYAPVARQIEKLARSTPGVDVARFMADNRDVSTLIPIRDALNERAVAARAGRGRKLMETAKALATGGGGAALGHLTGIPIAEAGAVGVTAYGATKLAQAVARRVDYKLALIAERAQRGPIPRVMLDDAARSGVPPALLLQLAQRAGVQEDRQ